MSSVCTQWLSPTALTSLMTAVFFETGDDCLLPFPQLHLHCRNNWLLLLLYRLPMQMNWARDVEPAMWKLCHGRNQCALSKTGEYVEVQCTSIETLEKWKSHQRVSRCCTVCQSQSGQASAFPSLQRAPFWPGYPKPCHFLLLLLQGKPIGDWWLLVTLSHALKVRETQTYAKAALPK